MTNNDSYNIPTVVFGTLSIVSFIIMVVTMIFEIDQLAEPCGWITLIFIILTAIFNRKRQKN